MAYYDHLEEDIGLFKLGVMVIDRLHCFHKLIRGGLLQCSVFYRKFVGETPVVVG